MDVLTVDFRKPSGPEPTDDTALQIITDCGNVTLDPKQHGDCASRLFLQTFFPNEIQNLLSSDKMTSDVASGVAKQGPLSHTCIQDHLIRTSILWWNSKF
ncbi:hypothetical protein XENOCAPTIV_021202 [Xenoophorus captivus]|uniref:Uncharacterized protein n=1 Tax=Xenoophorus captivus TaxID=1517983 RepID=A0ABV0QTR4_9TELE